MLVVLCLQWNQQSQFVSCRHHIRIPKSAEIVFEELRESGGGRLKSYDVVLLPPSVAYVSCTGADDVPRDSCKLLSNDGCCVYIVDLAASTAEIVENDCHRKRKSCYAFSKPFSQFPKELFVRVVSIARSFVVSNIAYQIP